MVFVFQDFFAEVVFEGVDIDVVLSAQQFLVRFGRVSELLLLLRCNMRPRHWHWHIAESCCARRMR